MKLTCSHVDTCLADFWSGHHLPHVQIMVDGPMTFAAIRRAILSELNDGAIAGNGELATRLANDDMEVYRAARAAVNRDVTPARKGDRLAFRDVEVSRNDCDETVYAFFVFSEA